jgi:hypothetical protein
MSRLLSGFGPRFIEFDWNFTKIPREANKKHLPRFAHKLISEIL